MFIKTDRLVIKRLEKEEEEDILALLTNESIKETYMIPDLFSRQEAISMFQKLLSTSHSDSHLMLGIYRNNRVIGFINDVDMDKSKVELGYVIHPDFQGQGYATEALKEIISYLFQSGYEEIAAGAFVDNIASITVMKKCGMQKLEKTEEIEYHNKIHHCIYYTIRKQWTN